MFFVLWCEVKPAGLSSITFNLTSSTLNPQSEVKVFEAIYEEMVISSEKPEERIYLLRAFLRTMLKLAYKLLFDVVHRVFLSQTGTNDQVHVYKFHIMAAVYLNLNVNGARILLVDMKDELKKVKRKIDIKGEVIHLEVKNRLNLCTKI